MPLRAFALFLVILLAVGAASAQQPSPSFLCKPESAPVHTERVPEYQRIGSPQTTTTIDVLFVVSPSFANPHRIGITVREVNQGFADSGSSVTLKEVGRRTAPSSIRTQLRRIEQTAISVETRFRYMEQLRDALRHDSSIERLRSEVRADLVVVLAEQGGRLGQGTAFQPGPSGFSRNAGFVVLSDSLYLETRKHLLMHEVGHTLGLAHQPGDPGWVAPYVRHGQGYAAADNNYGTVMAQRIFLHVPVFSFDGYYDYSGERLRVGGRNHRAGAAATVGAQFVADYEQSATPEPEPPPPDPPGDHSDTAATLDGGFKVTVTVNTNGDIWYDTTARVVDANLPGRQSALFYFFNPANAEMLVKVLDGCGHNGYRWVFIAAATDLGYEVKIQNQSGGTRYYDNPSGNRPIAVADTQAFSC